MQLIYKGRILRTFDKDAINFIDAAGLDNDANLNVSGLYTAEQARMAVNNLVADLKKYDLFRYGRFMYPCLGGNFDMSKINVFDTSNYNLQLQTGVPVISNKAIEFDGTFCLNTGFIASTDAPLQVTKELTCGFYVYKEPAIDGGNSESWAEMGAETKQTADSNPRDSIKLSVSSGNRILDNTAPFYGAKDLVYPNKRGALSTSSKLNSTVINTTVQREAQAPNGFGTSNAVRLYPNIEVYLGKVNSAFSTAMVYTHINMAWLFNKSFSVEEVKNLHRAIERFNVSLNRSGIR